MTITLAQKSKLALIALGAVLILIAGGVYIAYRERSSPLYMKRVVDPCTGAVGTIAPNQGPEKYSTPTTTPLAGGQPILDNGATSAQYAKVQQAIGQYSKMNLANKYNELAIIPGSFKAKFGQMTAKLCLGDKSRTVNLTIKLSDLKYVEVIVSDPSGKNGGDYNSGRLTVGSRS